MTKGHVVCNGALLIILTNVISLSGQPTQRFNILWPQFTMLIKLKNPNLSLEEILQARIIDNVAQVQGLVTSTYLNYNIPKTNFTMGPGVSWALLPSSGVGPRHAWLFQYRLAHLNNWHKWLLTTRVTYDNLHITKLETPKTRLSYMHRLRLAASVTFNITTKDRVTFLEELFVFRNKSAFSENRMQAGYSRDFSNKFSMSLSYFNRWVKAASLDSPTIWENAVVINSTLRLSLK